MGMKVALEKRGSGNKFSVLLLTGAFCQIVPKDTVEFIQNLQADARNIYYGIFIRPSSKRCLSLKDTSGLNGMIRIWRDGRHGAMPTDHDSQLADIFPMSDHNKAEVSRSYELACSSRESASRS